jgi:hypothetical protein
VSSNPLYRAVHDAILFLQDECREYIEEDMQQTLNLLRRDFSLGELDFRNLSRLIRLLIKHAKKPAAG